MLTDLARVGLDYGRRWIYKQIEEHERRGRGTRWSILAGLADASQLLNPVPSQLTRLVPPAGCSWMDPFAWKRGDDYFLFIEEWPRGRPHAHISVLQLDKAGRLTEESRTVVAEPYHLAYPFIFEFGGELYMMPDSNANLTLDLYRCESFPLRWAKVRTLIQGTCVADATLHQSRGRWWMLLTVQRGRYRLNHDLFVLSADSPTEGRWNELPQGPVVRGFDRARSAGRLFQAGGRLYRPSQDCLRRYGHGLNINEVTRLEDGRYTERIVRRVRPDWEKGLIGTHHLDWNSGLMVMDTQWDVNPGQP